MGMPQEAKRIVDWPPISWLKKSCSDAALPVFIPVALTKKTIQSRLGALLDVTATPLQSMTDDEIRQSAGFRSIKARTHFRITPFTNLPFRDTVMSSFAEVTYS
jgi:hypothetical protein